MHDHRHACECDHERVRYCTRCKIVHCLDCKQEWVSRPVTIYWPYSQYQYPIYSLRGVGTALSQSTTQTSDLTPQITCVHGPGDEGSA
jgi:hypothetical protein